MDVPDLPGTPSGESFYRRLVEAATEVVIAMIEPDGRIAYVNEASRWLLGYEPDEMVGRYFTELLPSDELSQGLRKFEKAKSGRPHFRQLAAERLEKLGAKVFIGHDATTEAPGFPRAADLEAEALRQAELVERLPAISYIAEPGAEGRWRYVSPQVEDVLGYPPERWVEDPGFWGRHIHPADRARVLDEEERDPGTGGTEYRMIASDGRVIWVRDEAVMRTDPDGSPRYDGILTDITERKRFESRLQFFAEHDPLTGVFNRRRFLDELNAEIRRLRRYDQPAALLMLDLDNLKDVNDSMGHRVGDALIRATARILTYAEDCSSSGPSPERPLLPPAQARDGCGLPGRASAEAARPARRAGARTGRRSSSTARSGTG